MDAAPAAELMAAPIDPAWVELRVLFGTSGSGASEMCDGSYLPSTLS
jgi:hypothetical protein